MSKKSNSHHVVPNPNGGWDVKRGGSSRASSHHEKSARPSIPGEKSAGIKALNFVSITAMGELQAAIVMAVIRFRRRADTAN